MRFTDIRRGLFIGGAASVATAWVMLTVFWHSIQAERKRADHAVEDLRAVETSRQQERDKQFLEMKAAELRLLTARIEQARAEWAQEARELENAKRRLQNQRTEYPFDDM